MQESRLLGTLLPASPDFLPIVQRLREKYGIPEVRPDDDPIEELFLEGEPVSLQEFREEIRTLVQEAVSAIPAQMVKLLKSARASVGRPLDMPWLNIIPEPEREEIRQLYGLVQKVGELVIGAVGQVESALADALYVFILTGETEEMPRDWISRVVTLKGQEETMVLAAATQLANPEAIVQEFRRQYKGAFGAHRPKVSKQMVSTAYYMRLQREGKKWDYIVEEYIDRAGVLLPRQRNTKRYFQMRQRAENRLRKRMQRCETVLSVLLEDKK